ncbi:thioredoxin domain-containing protein [Streptomyces sp. RFCAC02]|uniref:thioredoxin domain-containing protein n=1 Tax=Streptomyces sp. RFCAC02 TaxID=2499143 RepID=UPI0010211030|nr:thioredoxin domain-containing protein [Streptomyces sp. RFCAC02]
MSKRNSAEAKRAARERLQAEREREARRARLRRRLTVAGSAVVVLGIAAGVGVVVANQDGGGHDDTNWSAVRDQIDGKAAEAESAAFADGAPANTAGDDGLTVRVGDEDAPNTLTLYEDPRCPICATMEQTLGETIQQGVEDGTYNIEYVFGTFLDDSLGGSGSKNALSALAAALDVSPEAFTAYHEALYSADNHPDEQTDAYADDQTLIDIAQSVPELKDNADFSAAVENSSYAVWALKMSDKFDSTEDVTGTPTLRYNGEIVDTPQSPEAFEQMISENSQ